VEDPFLGEMKKLEKMIEHENEKLFSNPTLTDANKPPSKGSDAPPPSSGPPDHAAGSHNEPPRRRNRAELKLLYEMEAI
jgi:hypothetical protein